MPSVRRLLGTALLGLFATTAACTAASSEDATDAESDLTSVTARSRRLEFKGTVFVAPGADDATILTAVRTQAQTAFGPLRVAEIAVNSRELREVDPSTFVKREVTVVDPSVPNDPGRPMLEVKYTYTDDAVVALKYAERSTVPLALMGTGYRAQLERVLTECTPNDSHAREFASTAWYVFEPELARCQEAIRKEQEQIDGDRARLADPRNQVPKSEVDRLYLPMTAKLGADKTNRGASYPDYHRLFQGGVKQDKLVVSLVFGLIGHTPNTPPENDFNWGELMTALQLVMDAQGDFAFAEGPDHVDLSSFRLSSGRVVERPSPRDLVGLRAGGSSLDLSYEEQRELQSLFAARIDKKWIALERPIKVQVDGEAPRDFAIELLVYFGAESDSRPHKFATKNSDVFLYNGHSSIGYGPLDPSRFTAEDFAQTYQILWVDGCVSYNYYHKDYIPLKQGGTRNLDLVTNGIEAPAWRGGTANGQFLVKLLDGKGTSYRDLLLAAADTEALRVVDGELDNEFTPARHSVRILPR